MADLQKEKIRNLVNGVYDMQKLRIATGNRVVTNFRNALGIDTTKKLDDPENENTEVDSILKKLVSEFDRITDAYVNVFGSKGSVEKAIKKLDKETPLEYIKTKVDYGLVQNYVGLLNMEESSIKIVKMEVENHPMWDAFFKNVKGCGPLMSAICIAYFDPYKARHASSFWKYAGLDVVYNEETEKWEGRAMRHTEMREYVDKNGEVKEKKSITYNPFLKTKLVGVLGGSFLKAKGSQYGKIYYDYRNRLDNGINTKDLTANHKHRMATRYAVKMFLRDMWVAWRTLEGLEVTEPYEVAFLGRKPHHAP